MPEHGKKGSMQHPTTGKAPMYDDTTRKGGSPREGGVHKMGGHSHRNYTKDRKSGAPSDGDTAGRAGAHGNSGTRYH